MGEKREMANPSLRNVRDGYRELVGGFGRREFFSLCSPRPPLLPPKTKEAFFLFAEATSFPDDPEPGAGKEEEGANPLRKESG